MSQRKQKRPPTRSTSRRTRTQRVPPAAPSTVPAPAPAVPAQPAPDDVKGWQTYWKERELPWRRKPEISLARQQELAKRYAIVPDFKQGRYRLEEMKLTRADVEWLLATYQDQFLPEEGLDVRGAILDGADLSELPLNRLHGGASNDELVGAFDEQRKAVQVHMNKVSLDRAQLEGANLSGAQLEGANLSGAQLKGAYLSGAQLKDADLEEAHLEGAHLREAQLEGAYLGDAHLEGAHLDRAHLEGAHLVQAHLEGANLDRAYLEGAHLNRAHLEGAYLGSTILAGLDGIGPQVADIQWNGTNLAVVEWSQIAILGDEYIAGQKRDFSGNKKSKRHRLSDYRRAVRANRQLAVALQDQGLSEEASRFAYRANRLQCIVLWFQMLQFQPASGRRISFWYRVQKFGAWLFSHLLDLLAGYGYKPSRSFLAYLLIVFGFMGLYLLTSHVNTPHLTWDEALVLSLSSFHGRGFFPSTITLGDPYARLAVVEAILGLFVEVSLIATFTQRFFGK